MTTPDLTAPDTVVLDLGNVLVRWDPRRVWSRTMSDDAIAAFLEDTDFATLNHAMDAGRSYADTRAHVAQHWPHHVEALDSYWYAFDDALAGPVPGSAELVRDLRAAGVRLLGLTNWSAETFHHAPVAAPAIAELEDVLVSGRELLAKPDPAIFALLVERFGLVPGRTLFADDVAANVEAARAAGLHAHLFTTADLLREDLRRRGLDLPAT
jgi:2-haloacid dehalogenase